MKLKEHNLYRIELKGIPLFQTDKGYGFFENRAYLKEGDHFCLLELENYICK